MSDLNKQPAKSEPFSPAYLADLACHLEDEAAHGIGNHAAARLLASVERVERLLMAMVTTHAPQEWAEDGAHDPPVFYCTACASLKGKRHSGDCANVAARAYLTSRGLLKTEENVIPNNHDLKSDDLLLTVGVDGFRWPSRISCPRCGRKPDCQCTSEKGEKMLICHAERWEKAPKCQIGCIGVDCVGCPCWHHRTGEPA